MSAIKNIIQLAFPWQTQDPFLFCVHHEDFYPKGNESMGPVASLEGRNLGQDFEVKDGFRMYHGDTVPGFPAHPHRGFETVTVVTKGFIDHADSMGATARFGNGDVQWMTAGKGVQHSEMFPLLKKDGDNPLELFQIWLNLPAEKKFVEPHFSMLWAENIPTYKHEDSEGKATTVYVVSGQIEEVKSPNPAPESWAADPDNEVAIWTIAMEPGASWRIPASGAGSTRTLYFYKGGSLTLADQQIPANHGVELQADEGVDLVNSGEDEVKLLLLQGRPIGQPVAQYGPFVMNSQEEIMEAYADYQKTQFGGWPWPSHDHVHPREMGRYAKHADGTEEQR